MNNATALCFEALGDPVRRQLFEKLSRRAYPVGELAVGFPISRPAISQHLKVLKIAGLVKSHKQGTRRLYAVDMEGIQIMRAYLDRSWDQALTSFKDYVEKGR